MAYVLGLNSVYHESSACLFSNGVLLAFAEEERLNRRKHAKRALISNPDELPVRAIAYCLETSGLTPVDVDVIAFSFDPAARLAKTAGTGRLAAVGRGGWGTEEGERLFHDKIVGVVAKVSELFNRDVTDSFVFVPHHLCHAFSTFVHSGYDEAAILVADGIGECASTWVGYGKASQVHKLYEVEYPNSLGFLWEKMSEYLGFDEYAAAKVMGLSSYGRGPHFGDIEDLVSLSGTGIRPNRLSQMRSILRHGPGGSFTVDNSIMRFRTHDFSGIQAVFGVKKREPGTELNRDYSDIAAALQAVTEDTMVHLVREASLRTRSKKLCMAGGVALNCVANGKVLTSGLFDDVYIEPTANDAGTAFGAAIHAICNRLQGVKPQPINTAYLGPSYSDDAIVEALRESGVAWRRVAHIERTVAELIAQGSIVAWFQGAMEAGPRALGHRSILADPRDPVVREELNQRVKFREEFRPFCPSVLEEHVDAWFDVGAKHPDPLHYMLAAVPVKAGRIDRIRAVVHVDGTARLHIVRHNDCPRFWRLIDAFRQRTGIPMVLNTSFNIQEPIVCTPHDAISTFRRSRLRFLAIGDLMATKGE